MFLGAFYSKAAVAILTAMLLGSAPHGQPTVPAKATANVVAITDLGISQTVAQITKGLR